jgi:hypothetical protein
MPQSEQELAVTPMVIFLSHVIAKFPFSLVTNLRNLSRMISSVAVDAMQVLIRSLPPEFCYRKIHIFEQKISFLLRTVHTFCVLHLKHKLDSF